MPTRRNANFKLGMKGLRCSERSAGEGYSRLNFGKDSNLKAKSKIKQNTPEKKASIGPNHVVGKSVLGIATPQSS